MVQWIRWTGVELESFITPRVFTRLGSIELRLILSPLTPIIGF